MIYFLTYLICGVVATSLIFSQKKNREDFSKMYDLYDFKVFNRKVAIVGVVVLMIILWPILLFG